MYSSIQTSQTLTITCRCFEVTWVCVWSFMSSFCCYPLFFYYFFAPHEYFPLNPSLCLEGWLNQDYILCLFLIYLNQIDCFNAPDFWLMSGLLAYRKETKERSKYYHKISKSNQSQASWGINQFIAVLKSFSTLQLYYSFIYHLMDSVELLMVKLTQPTQAELTEVWNFV